MTPNDPSGDPFDDAAEPEIEDIEVEEPELEEADTVEAGKTPASAALATETPGRQAELLDLAHRLDVRPDDPAWLLVKAALEAHQAATTTAEAMNKLGDAPGAIERAALEGASKAAAEIQQRAAAGAEVITSTLSQQIEAAAAEPLRRALKPYLRDLSREAGDVRTAIREQTGSRVDRLVDGFLDRASKELDRRSIATKTSGRLSAVFLLILGAVLGVAGTKLDHRLSPVPIHQTPGGGFSVQVPPGNAGRFRHCGSQFCAFIYPSPTTGRGGQK